MRKVLMASLIPLCIVFGTTIVGAEDPAKSPTTQPSKKSKKPHKPTPPTVAANDGAAAFLDVVKVLQHPRCQNCHPIGDRPLQTDAGLPHALNISRRSAESGLPCSTCHGEQNADVVGVANGPPGAPHWGLPPAEAPMVFEGRSPKELCEQLKKPEETNGKDLAALLHHVSEDKLVLWGWAPGSNRTAPPLTHEQFVAAFTTWVNSGGACPDGT